jgi:transcriptional regulator with XRE-family HTH domain
MIYFKNIRLEKNLSTTKLAEMIGISQSYLSHIENGRRPLSNDIRDKLANVLEVDPKIIQESVREQAADSEYLNSWLRYLRINGLPFIKAFAFYLKDNPVDFQNEEDLKRMIVKFVSENIPSSVRTELENNRTLMGNIVMRLEKMLEKKIF